VRRWHRSKVRGSKGIRRVRASVDYVARESFTKVFLWSFPEFAKKPTQMCDAVHRELLAFVTRTQICLEPNNCVDTKR
jgi:hypothetical protein